MVWAHARTQNLCLTSGWMVQIRHQGTHTVGCAGPDITLSQRQSAHLMLNLSRDPKTGTTSYLLKRGFATTLARCWATLYGVGCVIVRAAKAVSLCLVRATSQHVFLCPVKTARSQPSPLRTTDGCPNKIPLKLVFHWSSLAEFPVVS